MMSTMDPSNATPAAIPAARATSAPDPKTAPLPAARQAADSVNPDAIPAAMPLVFGYLNGAVSRWPAKAWWRFPSSAKVAIDVDGTMWAEADEADVEAGDLDIPGAVGWIRNRVQAHGWWGSLYCNYENTYPGLRAAIEHAGLGGHTGYHVADWNLSRAQAVQLLQQPGIWAVQFEGARQTGKGYDLSMTRPAVFPAPPLIYNVVLTVHLTDGTGQTLTARPV